MLKNHYDIKPGSYYGNKRAEMLDFLPPDANKVLEIGCGEGAFGSAMKDWGVGHVTGIELFEDAARTAAQRIDRVLNTDALQGIDRLAGETFDCIVCNDVLEHLADPWAVLRRAHGLLTPGGVVVASIPNLRYFPVLKELVLQAEFEYQREGVLDRTHLRFFTCKSVARLFEETGYSVRELKGLRGIVFPWKFALMNRFLGGRFDDARYLQFACVAESPGVPAGNIS